eukprot:GEZU01029567.1.p1 GENE.GEZU01029567.1~~GEZU01029567.1.p1  ORF type:complete len:143 (-),score=60.13 GEZU01029567.1:190-618(-)
MADREDDDEVQVEEVENEAQLQAAINQRDQAVQRALNANNKAGALEAALSDPPLGIKNQKLRDQNSDIVKQVLTTVKETEIKDLVDKLNAEQADILMKYIYRILERVDNNKDSNIVLKWHATLTEKEGIGCIVRAIVDRKTL